MPVHQVVQDGKVIGYRYGETGKLYTIAECGSDAAARFKAIMQARAIEQSQQQAGQTPR